MHCLCSIPPPIAMPLSQPQPPWEIGKSMPLLLVIPTQVFGPKPDIMLVLCEKDLHLLQVFLLTPKRLRLHQPANLIVKCHRRSH